MIFEKCPNNEISWYYKGTIWCSSKLPCERCLTFNLGSCGRMPIKFDFDCDNCKYKFICFTCNTTELMQFRYDYFK